MVEYSAFSSEKYFGTEKVKTSRYCDVPEMVRYNFIVNVALFSGNDL